MPETKNYEPSEEEIAKIGRERLDFNDSDSTRAREAMNKTREMGEQGFRNMTAEVAEQIVQACRAVRVERIRPSSGLGENPSGRTADGMQQEAREAIEKLADYNSDTEPFDDAVVNVVGGSSVGRFGTPPKETMRIRAFHKAETEGGRAMIAEYEIPYSLWQGVEAESVIPVHPQIDKNSLYLIALKQEAERVLHQYYLAQERLKSLSINPEGGESIFSS